MSPSTPSTSSSVSSQDSLSSYIPGGYHPTRIGERFGANGRGRYEIVKKLGSGHFSTVWEAWDGIESTTVALKVVKSAPKYTETALDEVKLLEHLRYPLPESSGSERYRKLRRHPGREKIIHLLDHFTHTGPNGTHVCMTFEVMGMNVLKLIRKYKPDAIPLELVKEVSKQVLLGLHWCHRIAGVVHTDLKPENIMLNFPRGFSFNARHRDRDSSSSSYDPSGGYGYGFGRRRDVVGVKIVDFGNATWTDRHFTEHIQTTQYRCPEVIIGARWGTRADIWSLGCIVFEMSTGGDFLFQPRHHQSSSSRWRGFGGGRFSREEDHLAQIIELMGPIPKDVLNGGRYSGRWFGRGGNLRHIPIPTSTLTHQPTLYSLLRTKYNLSPHHATALSDFLEPMLQVDPEKRAKAREMIDHRWLEGWVREEEREGVDVATGVLRGLGR